MSCLNNNQPSPGDLIWIPSSVYIRRYINGARPFSTEKPSVGIVLGPCILSERLKVLWRGEVHEVPRALIRKIDDIADLKGVRVDKTSRN
jgi:hypothetical protein